MASQTMTRTKTTDRFGTVIYELREGGELVGTARKASGGWWVEQAGKEGGTLAGSIRKAEETLAFWRRLAR